MRYYVGLGNAGCKMLRHLHQLLVGEARANRPAGLPAKFIFGDADANNNVVNTIRGDRATPPGLEADLFALDLFWSGGCGVYHIIGELIAERALNRGLGNLFGNDLRNSLFILLAAGGGTGGGAASALEEYLHDPAQTPQRPVRLFVALPEVDRSGPADGGAAALEIHGPDDFQCAAGGRLLVRYLANAFLDIPVLQPAQRQMFVLSNSWLATIVNPASYARAFKRLNLFLSSVLSLMDDTTGVYPILNEGQNQLVTFGLGLTALPQPAPAGGPAPPPPPIDAAGLARQLVRAALGPLNLQDGDDGACPVGLSALPLPARLYCDPPPGGPDAPAPGALSELLDAAANPSQAALALRAAFHACRSVNVQLYYRTPELANTIDKAGLPKAVAALVESLFGDHRPITVNSLTRATDAGGWFGHHTPNLFPAVAPRLPADVALVVFLGNLLIEDVWRLLVYYLQSSFPWEAPNVDAVGDRLRDLVLKHQVRTNLLGAASQGPAAGLEDRRKFVWGQLSDQFVAALTDPTAPAWLPPDAKELYPEQFWGNFEQLRLKVLQNLRMIEGTFDERRLTIEHVARALAFLSLQVWEVGTGLTPAG